MAAEQFKDGQDVTEIGGVDAQPIAIRKVTKVSPSRVTLEGGHVYHLSAYGGWTAYGKTPRANIRGVLAGDAETIAKNAADARARRERQNFEGRLVRLVRSDVERIPDADLRTIINILDAAKVKP